MNADRRQEESINNQDHLQLARLDWIFSGPEINKLPVNLIILFRVSGIHVGWIRTICMKNLISWLKSVTQEWAKFRKV